MVDPIVVCLLPVRNAEVVIDAWVASVECFADAVIALDDGSTDATAQRLDAHALVKVLLRNPIRSSYEGWDDAGNRQQLVDAVGRLPALLGDDPSFTTRCIWVVQLDADERISRDDAEALRKYLLTEADPTYAYLLRCYRMIDDELHFDRRENWAGRVFAYRPGVRLPTDALHFVPLPVDIPPSSYRRTTIRIQHFGNATPSLRRARFDKYREVDPGGEHQRSYEHLLDEPETVLTWPARTPFTPFELHGPTSGPTSKPRVDVVPFDASLAAPGDLRSLIESSTADLVVVCHPQFVESPALLTAVENLQLTTAMGYVTGPRWSVPGSRLRRLLARSVASCSARPDDWYLGRPTECNIFRRDPLLSVLQAQSSLRTIEEVTEALWQAGHGVTFVPEVTLGMSGAQPGNHRTAFREAAVRGQRYARRTRDWHDESGALGEIDTNRFGYRAALYSVRTLLATIDRGQSPLQRVHAGFEKLLLSPLLVAIVIIEQYAARHDMRQHADSRSHRVRTTS